MSQYLEFIEVFPWNKNFETGIEEIDSQHRKLVDLLNQLANTLVSGDQVKILSVYDELANYATFHFESEERIWRDTFGQDSCFESHLMGHSSFLPKILQIKEDEQGESLSNAVEDIVRFLIRWLAFHIIDDDKRMSFVVQGVEQGLSLAEAKTSADYKMNGSIRILVETVLNMYDGLSSRALELMRERAERQKMELALKEANSKLEQANEMLESLSITDQLTGLHNRRHFERVFTRKLKSCRREQVYICLTILDIDHFKKLNDCYGHSSGDDALKKVAQALKDACDRPEDYPFRIGGEEFGIISCYQDKNESYAFAEKIRLCIEQLNIPNQESSVNDHLTASLGFFTEIPNKDSSLDNYLDKADANLYRAKNFGRNSVVG